MKISVLTAQGALLGFVLCSAAALAVPQQVSVDVSPLGGADIVLAFDFVDGGSPGNSITVGSFVTDGTLGTATATGSVTGSLPGGFTLSDADFFNELLQVVAGASTLSFEFAATANAPDPGSLPDTFALFLLGAQSQLPLFGTTDPTGSDALLTYQIDGSGGGLLAVYSAVPAGSAPVTWSVTPVPEPAAAWFLLAGLVAVLGVARRRRSWTATAKRGRTPSPLAGGVGVRGTIG
jgi:hypothetical protein